MFKDLRTRRLLADRIDSVNYEVEWAADNRTVFYGRDDAAHRAYRVHRHQLGASATDTVVFEDLDPLFNVDIAKSKDQKYLFINAESFTSIGHTLPDVRSAGRGVAGADAACSRTSCMPSSIMGMIS